jgi:cobalt transporter subunit CbtB
MNTQAEAGHATALSRSDPRVAAIAAFALGVLLFLGAGFAAPSALHNATHDTRHAFALPCH